MNVEHRRRRWLQSEEASQRHDKDADIAIQEEKKEEPYKYTLNFQKAPGNREDSVTNKQEREKTYENKQSRRRKRINDGKELLRLNTDDDSIALGVTPFGQSLSPPPKVPRKFFETNTKRRSHHYRPEKINIEGLNLREEERVAHSAKKETENPFIFKDNVPKVPLKRTRKRENQQKDSEQKTIKDILADKPEFASRAAPKPLIGTTNDEDANKPATTKSQRPTGRKKRSSTMLLNLVDDYRGRRMGYAPGIELQYSPTSQRRKKSTKGGNEDIFDVCASSKRRSASTNPKPKKKAAAKKDLEKTWFPPKMAENENMSIDGVVIKPLLDIHNEDSNSQMATLTGSDAPVCMDEIPIDISEFLKPEGPRKERKEGKKASLYEAPELKKVNDDSQGSTNIYEIPKANIKIRSLKPIEVPYDSPTSRTRRTRRPQ